MQGNHNDLEIYTNLIHDILKKTAWLNHKTESH